ncbi:MAG: hypothetical protein ACM319_05685, partial [Deltaproteobacteria bacterium]|nr:hypothetical protein [Candidatus Deferrimicrobiaceae bacterium]
MGIKKFVVWVAACSVLALPVFSSAAEMEHEGMHGMSHGHSDMKSGETIFSGEIGPWAAEARLIEKQAYMEKMGVPAKIAAQFAGERHLMMYLSDPMTGKPVTVSAGEVIITGPDKDTSSKVTLVVMEGHIGADVDLPKPGEYTFTAEIESGGKKGNA